jgi:hypothetical protein
MIPHRLTVAPAIVTHRPLMTRESDRVERFVAQLGQDVTGLPVIALTEIPH